jgi:hypothetical protein
MPCVCCVRKSNDIYAFTLKPYGLLKADKTNALCKVCVVRKLVHGV